MSRKQQLELAVSERMGAIAQVLPPGYALTLVARSLDGNAEAGMVFSDDLDHEAVIDAIKRSRDWQPASPTN
jgi:hypothetical protein